MKLSLPIIFHDPTTRLATDPLYKFKVPANQTWTLKSIEGVARAKGGAGANQVFDLKDDGTSVLTTTLAIGAATAGAFVAGVIDRTKAAIAGGSVVTVVVTGATDGVIDTTLTLIFERGLN